MVIKEKLKQKLTNAYNKLVDTVKGREITVITITASLGGLGAVYASYLLRDIELTFVKYFQIFFSPLPFLAVTAGFIGWIFFQIAMSTERISVLIPLSSTISTTMTVIGGVLILSEPMNIMKIIGVSLCILGIWFIYRNHNNKKT